MHMRIHIAKRNLAESIRSGSKSRYSMKRAIRVIIGFLNDEFQDFSGEDTVLSHSDIVSLEYAC